MGSKNKNNTDMKMRSSYERSYYKSKGSTCVYQHSVPRFVMTNFSYDYWDADAANSIKRMRGHVWCLDDRGRIDSKYTVSHRLSNSRLYSRVLDDSWELYEKPVYKVLYRIVHEQKTVITPGELNGCLIPLMAGMVAREPGLPSKMTATPIADSLYMVGTDVVRVLAMETMLTALQYANVSIVSSDDSGLGEFILPESGYVFDYYKNMGMLVVPISPKMALMARWSGNLTYDNECTDLDLCSGHERYSTAREQVLALRDSSYVLSRSRKTLDRLEELDRLPYSMRGEHVRKDDIMNWVYSWLPAKHLRDWVRLSGRMLADGQGLATLDVNKHGDVRTMFRLVKPVSGWVPPIIIVPSKDSGMELIQYGAHKTLNVNTTPKKCSRIRNVRWDVYDDNRGQDKPILKIL